MDCLYNFDFPAKHRCDSGWVTYEFYEDGTYKDLRSSFYGGEEHFYSMGKWRLVNDELTMDEDDNAYSKSPPRVYKIAVINKDKLYHTGHEGDGVVSVYTIFQRER